MLLAIDVGNSNTSLGVYDGDKLIIDWRVQTQLGRTVDEYGLFGRELLSLANLTFSDIDGVAISNVVPPTAAPLSEFSRKYVGVEPFIIDATMDYGIGIHAVPKSDVGADRIVNAVIAYALYGGPSVVVDMGTATTFDAIAQNGDYLGGAIAPGIGISVEALFSAASKLPRVELVCPPSAIGTTTKTGMQSGIVYGFAGQIDGIVERFINELGKDTKVIATGGLAEFIAKETKYVKIVNPTLMLDGLCLMYRRNKLLMQEQKP